MNKLYEDTAVQAIANAIRSKTGSSDTYKISEMSTALDEFSYYAKPTISNVALATFEADGLPLNSLKVSVEAKQDLHGYDKPWVGGAGKNKLENTLNTITYNGVTFTVNNDGSMLLSGTASGVAQRPINNTLALKAGQYVLSGMAQGGSSSTRMLYVADSNGIIARDTGNGATFTLAEDTTISVLCWINDEQIVNNVAVYPMIRLATESDATFAPYSNICPISGWDEAKVSDVGKNLLPMSVDGIKAVNTNGTWSGNKYTYNGDIITILTDSDENVTGFRVEKTGTHTGSSYISFNLGDFIFEDGESYILNGVDDGASTSTYRINIAGVGNYYTGDNAIVGDGNSHTVRIQTSYNSTQVTTIIYPMLRYASITDATYEPYNGVTTTISLGQTVYGGELDVVNGILKITDGYIASYNGETLPSTWISSMDEYAEGTTPTTGAEVCYELAEPIIINLTPSLIKSLNGINNLSVDCGEIIELEYFKEV